MSRSLAAALAAALTLTGVAVQAADKATGPAQRGFASLDTNGDGRITLEEYLAAESERFAMLDVRHRGTIDATDIGTAPAVERRVDRRAERLVRRLDANGDAHIDTSEAIAAADRRFDKSDADHDGRLTEIELAPRGGKREAAFARLRFEKLDANHDGTVDRTELRVNAQSRFGKVDVNDNGSTDAAEIAESPMVQERVALRADRVVQKLDTNHDGLVSRDEFLAGARTRFARFDRNGDGALTAADRPARHGKRHPA